MNFIQNWITESQFCPKLEDKLAACSCGAKIAAGRGNSGFIITVVVVSGNEDPIKNHGKSHRRQEILSWESTVNPSFFLTLQLWTHLKANSRMVKQMTVTIGVLSLNSEVLCLLLWTFVLMLTLDKHKIFGPLQAETKTQFWLVLCFM